MNLPAIEVGVVESVERLLHSLARLEFDDALVAHQLVSVGVRHFTRLPHVVFQVLPEREKHKQ